MTDNFIGETIYVAAVAPATNDAAGFEALTWVQAKGAQSLPQFGVSHNMIDVRICRADLPRQSKVRRKVSIHQ